MSFLDERGGTDESNIDWDRNFCFRAVFWSVLLYPLRGTGGQETGGTVPERMMEERQADNHRKEGDDHAG